MDSSQCVTRFIGHDYAWTEARQVLVLEKTRKTFRKVFMSQVVYELTMLR